MLATMQRGNVSKRPNAYGIVAAAIALFLTVFALLVFQLRSGRDPALCAEVAQTAVPAPKPKRRLIRKVIITRRIVHLPAKATAAAAATSVSAPAPATSAPAAAPAPAPAPAPLTSQSS
jgi:hypothetical protein